jgi:hypothetical protein
LVAASLLSPPPVRLIGERRTARLVTVTVPPPVVATVVTA